MNILENLTDPKARASVTVDFAPLKNSRAVVIHEIFGLSDWARSLTDELAEAGYKSGWTDTARGISEPLYVGGYSAWNHLRN